MMLKYTAREVVHVHSSHYLGIFVGERQVTILAGFPSDIDLELQQRYVRIILHQ